MNKGFVKEFFKRGAMFAWLGPVIMAIVWKILQANGVIESLTPDQVLLGTVSVSVMTFITAGITSIYMNEGLPIAIAGLIHFTVMYIDYLGIYLLNGWILKENIWIFSVIYLAGFLVIWFSIYIPIKIRVNRMNRQMSGN